MSDAVNGETVTGASASPRRSPTWVIATIAGGFGLFYAYAVWNALGNLIQATQLPTGLNGLGWFIWIFAAVFPILAFAAAFAIGYRRPVHHFLLAMLTGLALTAVFWLNVVAYTTLNTASLIG
jgi:hypothetical protein